MIILSRGRCRAAAENRAALWSATPPPSSSPSAPASASGYKQQKRLLLCSRIFCNCRRKTKAPRGTQPQDVLWLRKGDAEKQTAFKFDIVVQAITQIIHPAWKPYLLEMDTLQTFNLYFKLVILLIMSHPQATCFEE